MSSHPLDIALKLQASASAPGHFTGQSSPAYWNMVGPFGGTTAATLLEAVLRHPDLLGEPLSLTVNYAGAVNAGEFEVQAQPVRTNRSTQHWVITQLQKDAEGQPVVCTTATAVTAARRETWSVSDTPMPEVPPPDEVPRLDLARGVEWINRYEMRPVSGVIPQQWDGSGDSSLSQLWMRDQPPRPLDFCALAAMSDIFFPRVWLRRATRVPAGTVSITIYFHVGLAELAATGSGYLLGQARAQEFRNGFFDQTAQLWNQAGQLLVSTHQVVYFKE
ncbi:thioesterase family protein [Curvibacter sp. HBC61]|uniref:Thioesterase family protein n=1 Tax=Curvibacter cyanobacteriorum TaxID=3026422 RepID=A0ABT5MXY3_9BURK|nr:thioesterase family protein [Curvibacter sp. HBC61]MDD0838301.1 thioesterase family protein [Curvibacter sp. HBC61]